MHVHINLSADAPHSLNTTMPAPPEIHSPRRLLLVGSRHSGKLTFLKCRHPFPRLPTALSKLTRRVAMEALTGSLPTGLDDANRQGSHAGLLHEVVLQTQYYSARVPVWVDDIPCHSPAIADQAGEGGVGMKGGEGGGGEGGEGREGGREGPVGEGGVEGEGGEGGEGGGETLEAWTDTYLSPEAAEVLEALGGIVLTFRLDPAPLSLPSPSSASTGTGTGAGMGREQLEKTLAALHRIVRGMERSHNWDGVLLAVCMSPVCSPTTALTGQEGRGLEELCQRYGFEYVDFAPHSTKDGSGGGGGDGRAGPPRNEFGEVIGMHRVREALASNDWSCVHYPSWNGVGEDGEEEEEEEEDGLKAVVDEMGREMAGLHLAISDADGGVNDDGGGGEMHAQVEQLEATMARLAMLRGASPPPSPSLPIFFTFSLIPFPYLPLPISLSHPPSPFPFPFPLPSSPPPLSLSHGVVVDVLTGWQIWVTG